MIRLVRMANRAGALEMRHSVIHLYKLLQLGCGQGQALVQSLLDRVQDKFRELTALLPALIAQLHLELELAKHFHEITILLLVNGTPSDMEKRRHMKFILNLEIQG